jgi:peptide/nickel transport system permease protein
MSVLLVSHDWGVIADLCDRVAVMYAGQIIEQGPVRDLVTRPLHPYTQALLAAAPPASEAFATSGTRMIPTIPGAVPAPGAWPAGCHFAPRCPRVTDGCRRQPIKVYRPAQGHEVRCIHVDQEAA